MRFTVNAYHVGKKINLTNVRVNIDCSLEKKEKSFLLYEVYENAYVYIKDFGAIVFINCNEKSQDYFIQRLGIPNIRKNKLESEKFKIEIDADSRISIDFDLIVIDQFNLNIAHIVMLNIAQSVALRFYAKQTYGLIEDNKYYLTQLEELGRVKIGSKQMKKVIGKTMNLRHKIAENLYIFGTPELAWNDKSLSLLDSKLNEELDIKNRHYELQHNLDTIKETLDLFKDLIQHKHSSLLEWFIILLILLEVAQVFIEKLNL